MPKSLALKAPSISYGVRIGFILRGLDLFWSLGSLWKGRGWIWGLRNGIRTPLIKGLVLSKGFGVLRF